MTSDVRKEHNSSIDREQLALEVVRETGVQLSPDDSILTLIAVHDIVLKSYERRWTKAVNRIERSANAMGWTFLAAMCLGLLWFSVLTWLSI